MLEQSDRAVLLLFGGTVGGLVLATLAGFALRALRGESPALSNFLSRVWSSWLLALVLWAAFLTGRAGAVLLFGAASVLALREFTRLTEAGRSDRLAFAAAFWVLLPLQYLFVLLGRYGPFTILIPVYGFLVLPILSVLGNETRQFMARVSELQWGLMLGGFCLSHVPALLLVDLPGPEGRGILLVAFLIVVVQSSDLFQYAWGKLLGRHRLAPAVSPSKTWEGLVLGGASGTLVGAALWRLTPFSVPEAAAMALIVTLMGAFGGLVMSALKRDRGVKDWGTLIPGHGGVLDRLDSVLFAAPVFFHLTRFGWSG